MIKTLLTYTQDERRATLTGINLFFSALLGANLGGLSEVGLTDYAKYVILLAGAVTGVLTIGVAQRRSTVISTALAFAVVLGSIIVVPGIVGEDFRRMAVTLIIWLVLLLLVRFTPATEGPSGPLPLDEAEIELPPARQVKRGDA